MLSRFHLDFWEFALNDDTFRYIVTFFKVHWGMSHPTCDVFASNLTARMMTYASWRQDPHALARDAFLMKYWTPFPYLFPPTPLLPRVLREIETRKTLCILVAPLWTMKDWFPHLQRMEIARISLPPARDCLNHKIYQTVEASLDPLHAFLLDGSRPGRGNVV